MADPGERVRNRQDGGYRAPVLTEPDGGPVPPWTPLEKPDKGD